MGFDLKLLAHWLQVTTNKRGPNGGNTTENDGDKIAKAIDAIAFLMPTFKRKFA